MLNFLHNHNIPLIIISGSGLGGDSISMFLEKEGKLYSNIHIVSNSFELDEKWNTISLKKYSELYDVLILNDGNFDYINSLLKQITPK